MISQVNAACIYHMQVQSVKIETLVLDGLPELTVVGGADSKVKESVIRVMRALKNAGVKLPPKRVTVNFYPAEVKKTGSHMDLAIAVSIMAAYAFIDRNKIKDGIFIGEVGLNGDIMPVNGILPILKPAEKAGVRRCFISAQNAREAALCKKIEICAASSLRELIDILHGERSPQRIEVLSDGVKEQEITYDFSDVLGQPAVKRAAKIAAAGMHSFLMIGASGTGKTMTAERVRSILPPLTSEEQLELTELYSLAGITDINRPLMEQRQLRSVSSSVGIKRLAGDLKNKFPGEIVLADRGILFLDELSAFPANTLELIRQALDEGKVCFEDCGRIIRFPSRFMLVSCMNACKCGAYPDMAKCTCSIPEIKKHAGKISQSFLERIDICIHFPRIKYEALSQSYLKDDETTEMMREEVKKAFEMQRQRYKNTSMISNRDLTPDVIKNYCKLNKAQETLLKETYESLHLSVRTVHSILRVSRTIADLEQSEYIRTKHLIEAIALRNIDRNFWKV